MTEATVSVEQIDREAADWAGNDFARGAQACREMIARFVEQGGDAVTAASIRANWHPGWGDDPGLPPGIIDTWEPPQCPEGEADYAAWCSQSLEHREDEYEPALTVRMLREWGIPLYPANRHGQIPFVRALMESAIATLEKAAHRHNQSSADRARIERLEAALRDVVNPLGKLQRGAEAEGCHLNRMAYSVANDLHFVQSIARAALKDTAPHE